MVELHSHRPPFPTDSPIARAICPNFLISAFKVVIYHPASGRFTKNQWIANKIKIWKN
jgi:hypothetical protein